MNEAEWVALIVDRIRPLLIDADNSFQISQSQKLPYTREITRYCDDTPCEQKSQQYETDILISEQLNHTDWIPRLIVEAKINRVTTHDAITYSQKAAAHKTVHPYLRYGIILGHRQHFPLPGRLIRHGAHFDFMMSFAEFEPSDEEINSILNIIMDEIQASRQLEEIIYRSRKRDRKKYTILRRPLHLK